LKNYNLFEIIEKIEKLFPLKFAEKWDNIGLQVATSNKKIKKILLTIDLTPSIIEYSFKNNFDLIISHHPLIFTPLKNILPFYDPVANILFKLIKYDIPLYVMHTNLDKIFFDKLSKLFNLKKVKPLKPEINSKFGIGAYGELKNSITLKELILQIEKKLEIENLKFIGDLSQKIKRIAFCQGSGSEFINSILIKNNIDAFVTSDIKHHTALTALNMNKAIIDAGHYDTEKIMLPELKNKLAKIFPDIYFEISKIRTEPFKIFNLKEVK